MNVVEILSKHEGKTLEFKRDLTSPDGVLRTLVAFANTSGGRIVIGIEDGTKRVRGVKNVLSEEERLANLIGDSITPKLIPSIDILPWRKTQLLLIEIHPSANRPHHITRLGSEAGVYVRVGSTNRRADNILIEELKRYGQVASFDEQPLPDLHSEALDFRVASECFQPFRKLLRSDLKTLKLTTSYQGRTVPPLAASSYSARIGSTDFPMHGFRQAGSRAATNARSSTPWRFDRRSPVPPKMSWRSCENIPHAKP